MYSSTLSPTSVPDGVGLMPRPGRFNPGKETRCPGLVGSRAGPDATENLAWDSIPGPYSSSESLYRLSYPGPQHYFTETQYRE
jgi:hypothetical protein